MRLVPRVSGLLGLVALCQAASFPVLAKGPDSGYQLGRGYALGNTGIHLGGYASVHLEASKHQDDLGITPWSVEIADLSLFVSWDNGAKLRFFSEIEVEDAIIAREKTGVTTDAAHFLLERLYFEYLANDNLTVRIGKMLTPIGQWNVIHADPLVWTATRPVATENLFSEHVTGMMAYGTVAFGGQSLDYSVYGDYSSTLDPSPTSHPPYFDNALGLRLRYNLSDDLRLGLSYVDFALQSSPSTRNHLLGLDVAWTYEKLTVNSEIVYRNSSGTTGSSNAWQGYLQGVGHLWNGVYAVGRYEFFDQINRPLGQVGVLGLAYRPQPPLVWKLEYRLGEHNEDLAPDGLFASFAVLF